MLDILAWKEETEGWGVDRELYEELEAEWFARLEEEREEYLERETDWFCIARRAREYSERTGTEWGMPRNTKITAQVVTGARTTIFTAEHGEEKKIAGLEWKRLVKIWGDEKGVITEIEKAQQEENLTPKEKAALELGWEYWAGRSEDEFASKELDKVLLNVEQGMVERAESMRSHNEKIEEIIEKALRRGHGRDWEEGRVEEGDKKGTKRMEVRVTEQQKQWAAKKARTENQTVEEVWKVIIQDGIESLEKQRVRPH